jgi:hypothetical protein
MSRAHGKEKPMSNSKRTVTTMLIDFTYDTHIDWRRGRAFVVGTSC